MLPWIIANKEWFLSGIGIAIPIAIVGWWLQPASAGPSQCGGPHSVNVQVGRDISIHDNTEAQRAIRVGQLSAFRHSLFQSGFEFDRQLNAADCCREQNDVPGVGNALEKCIEHCREIITAYRLNRHLFDSLARIEIDEELATAEKDGEREPLLHFVTAIQLIHRHSEKAAQEFEDESKS